MPCLSQRDCGSGGGTRKRSDSSEAGKLKRQLCRELGGEEKFYLRVQNKDKTTKCSAARKKEKRLKKGGRSNGGQGRKRWVTIGGAYKKSMTLDTT